MDSSFVATFIGHNGQAALQVLESLVLLIDYGDRITVNMKDEGKSEMMGEIEKTFSSESIKISEVLGFNNIEFTFEKG